MSVSSLFSEALMGAFAIAIISLMALLFLGDVVQVQLWSVEREGGRDRLTLLHSHSFILIPSFSFFQSLSGFSTDRQSAA
jgi:hypothetical protein